MVDGGTAPGLPPALTAPSGNPSKPQTSLQTLSSTNNTTLSQTVSTIAIPRPRPTSVDPSRPTLSLSQIIKSKTITKKQ